MNNYRWKPKEEKNIIDHIKKHIFNVTKDKRINFEKKLWENEFAKYKTNLSDLIKDGPNKLVPYSLLYNTYNNIANNNIQEYKTAYIFKTKNVYSANYETDNGLTTCLQLDFNKWDKDEKLLIASCFFRQSTVINSSIIYTIKEILKGVPKEALYKIKGVKTNFYNYKYAIQNALYNSTNNEKPILFARRFLFYYFLKQFDYYSNPLRAKDYENELTLISKLIIKLSYDDLLSQSDKVEIGKYCSKNTNNTIDFIKSELTKLKEFKSKKLSEEIDIDCEEVLLELYMKSYWPKYIPENALSKELFEKGLLSIR